MENQGRIRQCSDNVWSMKGNLSYRIKIRYESASGVQHKVLSHQDVSHVY